MESIFNPQDEIILSTDKEQLGVFTYEEAQKIICNLSTRHNYGLMRNWIEDNVEYWDVGPLVLNIRRATSV